MSVLRDVPPGRSQDDLKVYTLDREYLAIANAFAFNIFNLGLVPAIEYLEQEKIPANPIAAQLSLEQKRAHYAQMLLGIVSANDRATPAKRLKQVLTEGDSRLRDRQQHQILQAVEHLKLAMQLGVQSKIIRHDKN